MTSKQLKIGVFILGLSICSFANAQEKKKPNIDKMFASFDSNNDKTLSLEEFKAKKRKNEIKPEALEKRFAKMDANSDGKVTVDEFKASLQGGKNKKKKTKD
ncbi:EF-hand domain-containing protein [Snuella lapsa]|uniref:EF-hand domain-containing protein n=1 Tax=Snuella lapsa TaxID=870481 RepID=A0ABP6WWE3_9FLAO